MHRASLETRLAQIKSGLAELPDCTALDHPIANWVVSGDRHLPQAFLMRPLRDVLSLTYSQLVNTPGLGYVRIGKLLDVLERVETPPVSRQPPHATQARAGAAENITPLAKTHCPEDITESEWIDWCCTIRDHRLHNEPLGRFASSLSDVPQSLWSVPLSEYTDRSLHNMRTMEGHGPARVRLIIETFWRIAQTVDKSAADAPLAIRLLPTLVRDAVLWTERVLRQSVVPSITEIRESFLRPLSLLIEADMGADTASIVRRRMGVDGPSETLEQIAQDLGITRERVRQIALKAVQVTLIRWPEGAYILDNVYALFLMTPNCEEQCELLRAILGTCFAIDATHGSSRNEILAAWDRAGKAKRTPMTESQVRTWAAEDFPAVSASVIFRMLEEQGLRHVDAERTLFFTDDPLDKLLRHLYVHPDPLPAGDLTDFIEGDERNIRNRIDRDARFIEDDSKRILSAESCSFIRRDGRWFLSLATLQGVTQRTPDIAISDLINLIIGGLVQLGICDATVWGIHRFTASLLRQVYGAALPPALTPFILASTLVRHSDGLVRPMRRRRLRWDSADGSVSVRGKVGWVDHVTYLASTPLTLDELDAALRTHFQDYEPYVLKQLNLTEDEEGLANVGYSFVPGISNVIPTMVIPSGWKLDLNATNVSEGVRLVVAKVVSMGSRQPFPRSYLRRLPWMVELCEHTAFGSMRWEDRDANVEDESTASPPPEARPQVRTDDVRVSKDDRPAAVDDLLSHFF
jgi:hypothetical protein